MGAGVVKHTAADDERTGKHSTPKSNSTCKPCEGKSHEVDLGWKVLMPEPNTFVCRFCGGRKCKREDWRRQKGKHAIKGLHSDWVTTNILACQRPSSRLIVEYDLVESFLRHNIRAIFNLQQPGEHPLCGDGITESGFSYLPQSFMKHDIFFYQFGWVDFGIPTLDYMLNIAQVMDFTIVRGQKLAVHCHAGLGRTGLAIAAYLTYARGMSASQAIAHVRSRRPGSLQTTGQCGFVHEFADYVTSLRMIFGDACDDSLPPYTVQDLVNRQQRFLHGEELNVYRYLPKIVQAICSELYRVDQQELINAAFKKWKATDEDQLKNLKLQINNGHYLGIQAAAPRHLLALLMDWLRGLSEPLIPSDAIKKPKSLKSMSGIGAKLSVSVDLATLSSVPSHCVVLTIDRILKLLSIIGTSQESQNRKKALTKTTVKSGRARISNSRKQAMLFEMFGHAVLRLEPDADWIGCSSRERGGYVNHISHPKFRGRELPVRSGSSKTEQLGFIMQDVLDRWSEFIGIRGNGSSKRRWLGSRKWPDMQALQKAYPNASRASILAMEHSISHNQQCAPSESLDDHGQYEGYYHDDQDTHHSEYESNASPRQHPPYLHQFSNDTADLSPSEKTRRIELKALLAGDTKDTPKDVKGNEVSADVDMGSFLAKRTCELFTSLPQTWQATVINELLSEYGKTVSRSRANTPKESIPYVASSNADSKKHSLPPISLQQIRSPSRTSHTAGAASQALTKATTAPTTPTYYSSRKPVRSPTSEAISARPPLPRATSGIHSGRSVTSARMTIVQGGLSDRGSYSQSPHPLIYTQKNHSGNKIFSSLDFARSADTSPRMVNKHSFGPLKNSDAASHPSSARSHYPGCSEAAAADLVPRVRSLTAEDKEEVLRNNFSCAEAKRAQYDSPRSLADELGNNDLD